jgi:phosphoglycerol transferase MdoB-like AlkP superfamily enzyme
VNSGNSADAEFMLNTSIYPLKRGSAFVRYPENSYMSLPLLFKEKGYRTIAIHGDNAEFWNRSNTYPALGYDAFISEELFSEKEPMGLGQSDRILFEESKKYIEDLSMGDEPYFCFIITTTSHFPFELPQYAKTLVVKQEDENVVTDYYQAISYVDEWLGNFVTELERNGEMKDTAIIVYGDHEGIHKYSSDKIGEELDANNQRTPLIIYCPSLLEQGRVIDTVAGQIDIYPTIAHLWGISPSSYSGYIMGRNILSKKDFVLMKDGSTIGGGTDYNWLNEGREMADLVIKSNYFEEHVFNTKPYK